MAKKHLLYITNDSWWDTDVSVLPEVTDAFDLEVYCWSKKDPAERKFRDKTLPGNVTLHDLTFGRSKKDIRMILSSLLYGIKLVFASIGKTTVWVLDNNLWYGYLFMAFASKRHTIISIHNYIDHGDARGWERRMKDSVIEKFKFFHFQSAIQEKAFRKDYPGKVSFSTTMPVKDFGQPSEDAVAKDKRTYLFFGYIRDYKRPDLFIKAANTLSNRANFILAGTGEDLQKYKALIAPQSKMECKLRLIDDKEIPDLFCSADFLVLPYDDSSQSGPLLIAYNYGLPVIASDLPYFDSMIDDRYTGFLFTKGDLYSLVETIEESIDMTQEEYSRMKDAMVRRAEEYKSPCSYCQSLMSFIADNQI